MTKKLYYDDAYIKSFTAEVLSVTECDDGFDVVLDQTAFFPEEGGQAADTGKIGECEVFDVYEKNGIIHHLAKNMPTLGSVDCSLDFDLRFEKMQLHTAEHIVCGIIHKLYGFENVGFHLGDDEVVFDIGGVLTREDLNRVELLANDAVFANLSVTTVFPSADDLSSLEYRSKLDLTENVRIVNIGDVDSCACCAPHVSRTGEVGLIKLLDFMKHRGGTRIWLVAGRRALLDYRSKYENILKISALLSAPQVDTAEVLEKTMKDVEALKNTLKRTREALAGANAAALPNEINNAVCFLEGFSFDELRAFANEYKTRVGGMTVALSGDEGEFRYVIASESVDLAKEIKAINAALSGRGGGKSRMVQGTFMTSSDEIKSYFK